MPEDQPRAARNRTLVREREAAERLLLADFWRRIKEGEIVAIGYPDSLENAPERISQEEWQWLSKQPKRDMGTFEGEGRVWHRVLFYKQEQILEWEDRQRRRREGLTLAEALEDLAEPEDLEGLRLVRDPKHSIYNFGARMRSVGGKYTDDGPDEGRVRARKYARHDREHKNEFKRRLEAGELRLRGRRDAFSGPEWIPANAAFRSIEFDWLQSSVASGQVQYFDVRVFPGDIELIENDRLSTDQSVRREATARGQKRLEQWLKEIKRLHPVVPPVPKSALRDIAVEDAGGTVTSNLFNRIWSEIFAKEDSYRRPGRPKGAHRPQCDDPRDLLPQFPL